MSMKAILMTEERTTNFHWSEGIVIGIKLAVPKLKSPHGSPLLT